MKKETTKSRDDGIGRDDDDDDEETMTKMTSNLKRYATTATCG